jgi:hypothetical protein
MLIRQMQATHSCSTSSKSLSRGLFGKADSTRNFKPVLLKIWFEIWPHWTFMRESRDILACIERTGSREFGDPTTANERFATRSLLPGSYRVEQLAVAQAKCGTESPNNRYESKRL